jgi:hypothetical protein
MRSLAVEEAFTMSTKLIGAGEVREPGQRFDRDAE